MADKAQVSQQFVEFGAVAPDNFQTSQQFVEFGYFTPDKAQVSQQFVEFAHIESGYLERQEARGIERGVWRS